MEKLLLPLPRPPPRPQLLAAIHPSVRVEPSDLLIAEVGSARLSQGKNGLPVVRRLVDRRAQDEKLHFDFGCIMLEVGILMDAGQWQQSMAQWFG